MIFRIWIALALLTTATPALALNCAKAANATERTICRDPHIKQADAALTQLYAQVRVAVAPHARPLLVRQQKDWIAVRDARCRANQLCLRTAYQSRIAALTSLKATADAQDEPLTDVTPITLQGEWHVDGVTDPTGHSLPADLARQLVMSGLPLPGTTVRAAPGKLCLGSEACAAVGWTATTLGAIEGGPRIADDIRLPRSTRTYTGTDGSKWANHFTVIRRADGRLLVLVGLCDAKGASECRNAYEVWRPTSANSRLVEGTGSPERLSR